VGFRAALESLRGDNPIHQQPHRDRARESMVDRRWYLGILHRCDPQHADETLATIFRLVVIPDLDRPEVADQIRYWAGQAGAPAAVIKALNAAAWTQPAKAALMRQILAPPLAWRWQKDAGIAVEPAPYGDVHVPAASADVPARSQGAHRAGSALPLVESIMGDPIRALLAAICLVLVVLLIAGPY
jgi:hypothetical protein